MNNSVHFEIVRIFLSEYKIVKEILEYKLFMLYRFPFFIVFWQTRQILSYLLKLYKSKE